MMIIRITTWNIPTYDLFCILTSSSFIVLLLTIPSKSNALLASANQYIACILKRYGALFRLLPELPMSDIPSNSSGIDIDLANWNIADNFLSSIW